MSRLVPNQIQVVSFCKWHILWLHFLSFKSVACHKRQFHSKINLYWHGKFSHLGDDQSNLWTLKSFWKFWKFLTRFLFSGEDAIWDPADEGPTEAGLCKRGFQNWRIICNSMKLNVGANPRLKNFLWQNHLCQVTTLEEEIEELRRKFEASKDSRSSKSDNFGLHDEGRGSRCILYFASLFFKY